MALQFILGGAGSGKTRALYDRVIRESMEHPKQKYLAVVPGQPTMRTQKEIIRLHPRHGIMNIDTLSSKRLAYRIFEDLGVRIPVVLDDIGKFMVLRKMAGLKRGKLFLYRGHLEQSGFISQLRSQISGLPQHGIMPDIPKEVRGEIDAPLLVQKLEDLKVIYSGLREYIESHYITTEEILGILYRKPLRWEPLKDSIIPLGGYTGFAPVQYRLVELFLMHAGDAVCTVITDSKESAHKENSVQHLFYTSRHTACRVASVAERYGTPKKEDIICNRHPT